MRNETDWNSFFGCYHSPVRHPQTTVVSHLSKSNCISIYYKLIGKIKNKEEDSI